LVSWNYRHAAPFFLKGKSWVLFTVVSPGPNTKPRTTWRLNKHLWKEFVPWVTKEDCVLGKDSYNLKSPVGMGRFSIQDDSVKTVRLRSRGWANYYSFLSRKSHKNECILSS
jgi:hypothetical protein